MLTFLRSSEFARASRKSCPSCVTSLTNLPTQSKHSQVLPLRPSLQIRYWIALSTPFCHIRIYENLLPFVAKNTQLDMSIHHLTFFFTRAQAMRHIVQKISWHRANALFFFESQLFAGNRHRNTRHWQCSFASYWGDLPWFDLAILLFSNIASENFMLFSHIARHHLKRVYVDLRVQRLLGILFRISKLRNHLQLLRR